MPQAERTLSEELIWDIYKSLTAQCEHFNTLESTYRTLASTWLLAAFAAVGFILKELSSSHSLLLVSAVSGAAAGGVYLLWILDIMVYHRLLSAAFAEQMAMENRYSWLPKTAHGMMEAHGGEGVLKRVVWYYIASFLTLVAIGTAALTAEMTFLSFSAKSLSFVLLLGLVGGGIARYMQTAGCAKTKEFAVYNETTT